MLMRFIHSYSFIKQFVRTQTAEYTSSGCVEGYSMDCEQRLQRLLITGRRVSGIDCGVEGSKPGGNSTDIKRVDDIARG
jgi:hypothetical protein